MSTPEETTRTAEPQADAPERERDGGALIDADVEADVNAAVPDDDELDERNEDD